MRGILVLAILCFIPSGRNAWSEDISLTVYNTDLAVVKVVDTMSFKSGRQTVSMTDVAEMVDPTSVRFSSEKGDVRIIEQNYRYDLINPHKVLQRYIDRDIAIRLKEGDFIEGILQSVSSDVVIKSRDGKLNIVKEDAIQRFEFPELPEGLITRPTLVWDIYSEKNITTPTEVSYMTQGISWHAEYTAVTSDNDDAVELSSWVSVENNSGTSYDDATLKLVAGDVHRVTPPMPQFSRQMVKSAAMAEDFAGGFEERGLFEYHLYELKGKTMVQNAEIKQISLFEPVTTNAKKLFVYDARKDSEKVSVSLEFVNSQKDGLGMPLPAGKVRVYKRDTDGSLEFIGEDALDHTPKNEKVRLVMGNAFDCVGERLVTDTKRITQRIREETIEIKLRNRKEEAVTITAVEHLWGDWEIREKSVEYVKKDARTIEFTVLVPADGEMVITYTVRYN
ncbi:MAG: DUF4139 domain-containing protein [Candidatus Latescibacteria bacterium]|nr:DUF4139 domain-containing protein [Candidatus Latescibacterota bacterium]